MKKLEWDYTELAESYLKRPDYSEEAIRKMFEVTGVKKGDKACDIGAGVAHLTLWLLKYGLNVNAVEPNEKMRIIGQNRTEQNRTLLGQLVQGKIPKCRQIILTW